MAATSTFNEALLDQDSVTKAQFETIARKLLQDISYKPLTMSQDVALESFVLEQLLDVARDQHLDLQKIPQIAKLSVQTVHLIYPWHEKELQKLIAIYLAYFYIIDDYVENLLPSLRAFRQNLLAGTSNGPVLDSWMKISAQTVAYYGPFASDFIYSSTFELISMAVFESEMEGKFYCGPHAPNFPRYLRSKAGILEAFAKYLFPEKAFPEATCLQHYLPATPDLLELNASMNDVFSFYKESVVSTERNNYVYNYSAARGVTVHKALEDIAASLAECIRRLRLLFSSEPEMLKVVNSFIEGYIAMNWLPRYRLHECDLPKVLAQGQNSQG
ncbi:hypothetical protein BPAE_0068g00040 [Botrytis paeoniae]|uniref:Trichodiene synthase n=1 Tax=Botrytis paeoniae TaxID=278948 RepID=A0A4Z1FRH5_9HELO|nr:hypothetical protein BPAE_0068g00040 [Botrytis paeoniae]